MTKRTTLKDIAAKAGVSVSLVSFVMSEYVDGVSSGQRRYRVGAETRKKILDIAEELDYHPNNAARMLRGGNSLVIGAVLADISNVFYGEVARCLEDAAHKTGHTMLIGSTDEEPAKFSSIVQSFIFRGVDGLIVFPCKGCSDEMRSLESSGIPMVVMDRKDFYVKAPTIVVNGRKAMNKAVEVLRAKGVNDIEMISYTLRISSITDREEGYIEAVGEEKSRIHRLDMNNLEVESEALLSDLMTRGVKGVVTATNALAVALIKTMLRRGIQPGLDINIFGFDSDNLYDIYPPVPHIKQPVQQMCNCAFDNLLSIMDGRAPQEYNLIEFDGILYQ